MEERKKLLKSKTFWINLLSAAIVPFLPDELKKPEYLVYVMSAVNVALRLLTKNKVTLI